MEQMTITAKVQIVITDVDKILLDKTMSAYRDACNYVSHYVFRTHDLKQFSLNKALYSILREKFSLKSQMAQSVLKTVVARYKTILKNQNKWIQPTFKKPQYDLVWNRDYSLTRNCFSVNTLDGRVKLLYFSEGISEYFDSTIYKFGTAKLVNKHGKYYLYIPVTYTVHESNIFDICNVVGIDRGINFIAVTYGSNHKSVFFNGRIVKQKRINYFKLRKKLQMRQTSSARRRLKVIGQRENRWMQNVNHCVSKALVKNNPKHTLFVLEDLSSIRDVIGCIKIKDRYVFTSWAFYDLEQKLIYKAKQNQSSVIKVAPHYTSQCCPICGHIERFNRDKRVHLFTCKNCGYKSNDDRVGAMNLYHMGISYLKEAQVPDTVVTE